MHRLTYWTDRFNNVSVTSNVGRPLEFDPDAALEAAMQRFWSNGYEHTSMQDLLVAMNLSKSSLYQAFGGKQPLFRRCVSRYTDQIASGLRDGLSKAPSGRRFIDAFLNSVLRDIKDRQGPRGCLVMNTATEFAQSEPEIAHDVTTSIDRFRDVYRQQWNAPRRKATFLVTATPVCCPIIWSAA